MARIGLVVPALDYEGGVQSVAQFLVKTIRERSDHDLKIISLATSSRDTESRRLLAPGTWATPVRTRQGVFEEMAFTHVGARFTEFEFQRYKPRAALTRELRALDLIQVVCGTPSWAIPVVGLGIPVSMQVATLIEVERRALLNGASGLKGALTRYMTRRNAAIETMALRSVDAVQVENAWMQEHVERVAGDTGTHVVFAAPGVDENLFHPPDRPPVQPGYILSVGRMRDPRKNHMMLLAAFANLCQRMDRPPRLALAGSDGPTDAFRTRAVELGLWSQIDVHIFPSVQDLAELYRGAIAYALASDEEGFGISVVEAMASGVPAVSTRSGGPDGIIADGVDGYLVDRDDAPAMANRLERIATDLRQREALSLAARRKVEAIYGEKPTGDAFLSVFDRLLSSSRTGH
ncbi:MAG: glycosyltransferase family 4 protein [Pseudomonadota bacterium]